jgi:protein SCO1/2
MILQLLLIACASWSANNAPKPYSQQADPLVATQVPEQLKDVGIKENLGAVLDLNLPFVNEQGQSVVLAQYFGGKKPVIISPIYYSCPGLCNFHLNGLVDGLKGLDWTVGNQFDVIAVSFDATETPDLAKSKKDNYMKVYDRPGSESGWHFLTANSQTVKALTDSLGFKFKWSEEMKEWSHASAAIIISPEGKISRYLPGIVFEPKTLKLALNEGSQGKVGNLIDSLILYCFQYNPHKSEYTLVAFQIMKLAAFLTVLIFIFWMVPVWIRSIKAEKKL